MCGLSDKKEYGCSRILVAKDSTIIRIIACFSNMGTVGGALFSSSLIPYCKAVLSPFHR